MYVARGCGSSVHKGPPLHYLSPLTSSAGPVWLALGAWACLLLLTTKLETRREKEWAKKNKRKGFDGLSGLVFSWWVLSHLVEAVCAGRGWGAPRKQANITQWNRFCVNREAVLNHRPGSLTSEKGGKWSWRGCFPRSLEALVKKPKCRVFFWTRGTPRVVIRKATCPDTKTRNCKKIPKWASSSVPFPQADASGYSDEGAVDG